MARIAGVNIPTNKRVVIALQYIHGIGQTKAQEIALPWTSVIVIIVLLNVEFTWAMPDVMFLRSRLRMRVASLAIVQPFRNRLFLLAGDRLGRALAGARIGMRALAADRQAAAMAQAAV